MTVPRGNRRRIGLENDAPYISRTQARPNMRQLPHFGRPPSCLAGVAARAADRQLAVAASSLTAQRATGIWSRPYALDALMSNVTDLSPGPAVLSPVDFGLGLKRVQHLLALRIDEVLLPLNLNLGLWAVLREVGRAPGASASELARASFCTPQTLGGLLQRLQARGLVERSTGRGRIVENHLTPRGASMLRQATAAVEEMI